MLTLKVLFGDALKVHEIFFQHLVTFLSFPLSHRALEFSYKYKTVQNEKYDYCCYNN